MFRRLIVAVSLLTTMIPSYAVGVPKSAEDFANQYMAAFNAKDADTLQKLRYPSKTQSNMQQMMDEIRQAEMESGTQFNKFEILPPQADMDKPTMGPDGMFYKVNLKATNMVKLISVTKNGTTSISMPIGVKDGVYYEVSIEPADEAMPPYQFGWQRFEAPKSNWSVMLPNEPEPGKAAIEQQYGKEAVNDPDIYGVVKNTAAIKTTQHWYRCGQEGKRINDATNNQIYRVACTTYEPETLKQYFADPAKNLDDAIQSQLRQNEGKLLNQKQITLAGSPGVEFEIKDKDGVVRLGRLYWIKDALYELSVETKKDSPDLVSVNKFLSSLEVH